MLDVLDSKILECVGKDNPEDELIQIYIDFWTALKERVGTSRGFTGLSEYVFFRYVIGFVDKQLGVKLTPQQCTKETCVFESQSLLVTRDVWLSQFDASAPKQKSDIAIFTRADETTHWRLASVFEIKVGITGPVKLSETFERMNMLLGSSQAFAFLIIFNSLNSGPQYRVALDHFCSDWSGRAFVISKTYPSGARYGSRISLNEALDRSLTAS